MPPGLDHRDEGYVLSTTVPCSVALHRHQFSIYIVIKGLMDWTLQYNCTMQLQFVLSVVL